MSQPLKPTQIASLKQDLLCLAEQLQELLDTHSESVSTVTLDQSKVGRLSRMDALQQQAINQASRHQHQQRLRLIQLALQAINDNEYGFCSECGADIPFARLQARPESLTCIACQAQAES